MNFLPCAWSELTYLSWEHASWPRCRIDVPRQSATFFRSVLMFCIRQLVEGRPECLRSFIDPISLHFYSLFTVNDVKYLFRLHFLKKLQAVAIKFCVLLCSALFLITLSWFLFALLYFLNFWYPLKMSKYLLTPEKFTWESV